MTVESMPLVKVAAAFAVMLAGMRFKIGLWQSILLGGVVLGLAFGLSPVEQLAAAGRALTDPKTLFLSAIVGLIMVLSDILEQSGQSLRLVKCLSGHLSRPRLRLVFFPALIGLLPMPGGAVFSAPMVRGVAKGMGLKQEDKALLNYWFRHVWEFCWPLYPGLILASSLAEVHLARFVLYTMPGSVALIFLGWVFLLRPGALPMEKGLAFTVGGKGSAAQILREGGPLLAAIAGSLALEGILPAIVPGLDFEWGIIAGLVLAISLAVVQNGLTHQTVMRLLFRRHLIRMLLVVASIFLFKELLQAAGVVRELAEMAQGRAVLVMTVVGLPFLVGMVGGIAIAFIGATFPLILGLLQQLGMAEQLLPILCLGLFSGFAGVMGSPMHICFVLTCEYFGVDLLRVWRRLLMPCAGLVIFGLCYYLALG